MFLLDKTQVLSLKQVLAAVRALASFHGVWWAWFRKEANTEDGNLRLADVDDVFSKGRRYPIRTNEPFSSLMKVLVKLAEECGNKDLSHR